MRTEIKRRENPFLSKYSTEDYDTARNFATKLFKEFGGFIKGIMIFGGEGGATSEVAPRIEDVYSPEEKHKSFLREVKIAMHPQQQQHASELHKNQHAKNSAQDFLQNSLLQDQNQTPDQKAKNPLSKGDIDILVIIDNVSFYLTPEIIEVYRVVTEKIAVETSKRLHITTLRITSFWEYMRVGDPVAINILRSGIALIDTGFIYPMQLLLFEGRIRPSAESISSYFGRSSNALMSSRARIMQATMDLYWAAIDSAHAAIMHTGEIPTSPKETSRLLHEKFVKTGIINKKYPSIMDNMYNISRKVMHQELRHIDGKDFEKMHAEVKDFVETMKKISGRK